MKALPDVKSSDVADNDADAEVVIPGESDTVQVAFDSGRPVIESTGLYSSQSDTEVADVKKEFNLLSHESQEDDEEEENCRRHKSKKKHKKHHHHHHKHDSGGIRKKHKKHKKRVEPIFLWAQNRDSKILRVVCEDYDPHNRLRLVKTGGVWTSNPRSRVQLIKSRSSSRYGDDSQKDTDEESTDDGPGCKQPNDGDDHDHKAVAKKQLDDDDEQVQYVDLNDNSIDLVETVCSEEDEDEQQAQIERALEMIQRDPTLVTTGNEVKIPPLGTIETAGLKLPEGTTIHQVKTEHNVSTFSDRPVLLTSPPIPVPLSPPKTAASLQQQCKYGELTIIPQKDLEDQRLQLQNEPLNLETACKRPALEIRLQEPPPVKKRRVDRPPQQQRLQQQPHKLQSLKQQQPQQPAPPPPPKSLPIGVKREWDPLSELKEVLSDPRLSVPDPLLVPKARLAALVASPATEIPKLLQQRPPSLLPPPDPDLLTVSLSHLQSILLQHADEQRGNGKAVDASHLHQSSSNIDQMLWLSYLSTCKDMAGTDADLLSSMLNLLLPPAQNATAAGQPPYGGYHTAQQQNQWNDFYYTNLVVPTYGGGGTTAAGYSKSDDFCASPVLPPQQQKQQAQSSQKHHHQQKTHLPPAAVKQRGVCPEMQCCNRASSLPHVQPSTCYDMCCAKAGVCNPFVMQLSPAGCGGGGGGGGNLKAAAVYTASDGVATAATAAPATCCFPAEMGCSYGCHQPPPSPVSRKHHVPPQASPGSRNRGTPYGYQTGLGQHHQLLQQQLQTLPSSEYGNVDGGGDVQKQCSMDVTKKPQTSPLPTPPASATPSSHSTESGGDAAVAKPPPLQKAKIKVKQHLIDPNAKPKLLNIEGQLHLAGAHDLLSSPLWHPLFGSQEKRYGCRWQWTTPVTTSESTTSSDTSGTH